MRKRDKHTCLDEQRPKIYVDDLVETEVHRCYCFGKIDENALTNYWHFNQKIMREIDRLQCLISSEEVLIHIRDEIIRHIDMN